MIKKIIEQIDKHQKIVLFHHQGIDGDSLATSYGLLLALKKAYPSKTIKWIADKEFINKRFAFLNVSFEDVVTEIDESWLAIVGDVSGVERIFGSEEYLKAKTKVCLDHHLNVIDHEATLFWHEPTYPASALQACELVDALNIELTQEIALILWFGIVTDTGRFAYSLANPKPLIASAKLLPYIGNEKVDYVYQKLNEKSIADIRFQGYVLQNFLIKEKVAYITITKEIQDQLNLEPDDCVKVNYLANISDIKSWIFFIQYPEYVRVEFRSLGVPMNEVAKLFDGGGHLRAAGCKLASMEEHAKVVDETIQAIKRAENGN